jgi:hypothetical protein
VRSPLLDRLDPRQIVGQLRIRRPVELPRPFGLGPRLSRRRPIPRRRCPVLGGRLPIRRLKLPVDGRLLESAQLAGIGGSLPPVGRPAA